MNRKIYAMFRACLVAFLGLSALQATASNTLGARSARASRVLTIPMQASADAYQSAVKLFEKVQGERDRQFSFFSQMTISEDATKHDLPVALKVKFRGRTVYTAVDNIDYDVANNTYKCTLYAMISIPELGKEYLYFKASDVPFNYAGMVSSDNVVMSLLSSATNSATISTDMGSFKLKPSECKLYMGCLGITKVSLSGDLALKTDYFVSASDDTSPVTAHVGAFDITDAEIVSMQGKVSVDPFKIVACKATPSTPTSTTAVAKVATAAIVLQEFEFSIDSTANNALFCFNSPIKDSKTGKALSFPTNYLGRIYGTTDGQTPTTGGAVGDPNQGVGKNELSSMDYQGMGNWTGIVAENVNIKWNCKYAGPNKKDLPAAKLVIDELGLTTQIEVDAQAGQYTHSGQGALSGTGSSLGGSVSNNSPMGAGMDGRSGMDALWAVSMVALKMDINRNAVANGTCKGKVYVPFFMSDFEFNGKVSVVVSPLNITGKTSSVELSDLMTMFGSNTKEGKALNKVKDFNITKAYQAGDPNKAPEPSDAEKKLVDSVKALYTPAQSVAQVGWFLYELTPAQNMMQQYRTRIGWQYQVGKGMKVLMYTNDNPGQEFTFAFYTSGQFQAHGANAGGAAGAFFIKNLKVENLRLSNHKPYFDVDYIGFQNREAGEPGHLMAGKDDGQLTFMEGNNSGKEDVPGGRNAPAAPERDTNPRNYANNQTAAYSTYSDPQTGQNNINPGEVTSGGWGFDIGEVWFGKRKDVAGNLIVGKSGELAYMFHIDLGFALIGKTNFAEERQGVRTNNYTEDAKGAGKGAGPGMDARFGLSLFFETDMAESIKLVGGAVDRIRVYWEICAAPNEMLLLVDVKLEGGFVAGDTGSGDRAKEVQENSKLSLDALFFWENFCRIKLVGTIGKYKGETFFLIDFMFANLMPVMLGFNCVPPGVLGPVGLCFYRLGCSWNMSYGKSTNDKGEWQPKWRGNDVMTDQNVFQNQEALNAPNYVVDLSAGLGIKAGVQFGLQANPHMFTAYLTLEVIFNDDWGVKTVRLFGVGEFFRQGSQAEMGVVNTAGGVEGPQPKNSGVDSFGTAGRSQAPIQAYLDILLDFDAGVLDAYLDVYMDFELPGYGQLIFGAGRNNYLCSAGIFVNWGRKDKPGAPTDWYVFIGRPEAPSEPCLGLNLGFMRQVIYFQAYFMCGTRSPNPKLNPRLNALSKLVKMDNTDINPIALGSGLRFLVGASIELDFGFDFFVYAYLRAGIGFNLMIADYGSATCKGGDGTPIGWLAQGSVFAYIEGGLGINFGGWKFEIVELGLGATLNGQFIGNAWFNGDFSVHYCILGGLVEGDADWSFDVGNRCVPVGKNGKIIIPKLQLISEYKPKGDQEASIFSIPAVAFNAKMSDPANKIEEPITADGSEIIRKVVLDQATLVAKRNNVTIATNVSYSWNEEHTIIQFRNGKESFPGSAEYSCYVKVHVEEKKKGASNFTISRYEDADPARHYLGTVVGQDSTFKHKTAESPSRIDDENIEYTYPVRNQLNLYTQESDRGYVQLKMGQKYLLKNSNLTYVYRFTNLSKQATPIEFPFSYDVDLVKVDYQSLNSLVKEQLYRLELIAKPANPGSMAAGSNTIDLGDCKMKFTTINGNANSGEANLYTAYFRTSKYDKLGDKLAEGNRKNSRKVIDIATGYVYVFGERFQLDEPFDKYELYGDKSNSPLIEVMADRDVSWYTNYLDNLYNRYPVKYDKNNTNKQLTFSHRQAHVVPANYLGAINSDKNYVASRPLWDVDMYDCQGGNLELTQQAVDNRYVEMPQREFILRYLVPISAWSDYDNLRNQLVSQAINGVSMSDDATYLLYTYKHRDVLPNNTYPVHLYYRLPGAFENRSYGSPSQKMNLSF